MRFKPLLLLLAVLTLAGCARQTRAAKLQVVASVDFYGEVAKAVAGKHADVSSVINNPAIDPHDFQPTTEDGKRVAAADVVVANGAGYDTWLTRLARTNPDATTVSAAKVVGVKNGENEHIWYKPQALAQLAQALASAYAKKDPEHRQAYAANAKRYIATLAPLQQDVAALRRRLAGRTALVSEPVFNNMLAALGVKVGNAHFANAIEEGSDPTPADIRHNQRLLDAHRVAFVVVNKQVQSKAVDALRQEAEAQGVPVLAVTETMPAKRTYLQWQRQQLQVLGKLIRER